MTATPKPKTAAFQRAFRVNLFKLSPRLTQVLRRLIAHPWPAEFWQLDFEIHDFSDGFPVRMYFYKRAFDQILDGDRGSDLYPFSIPSSLLRVRSVCPRSFLAKFKITDNDIWHIPIMQSEVLVHFWKCWKAAGGSKFPFRAMIATHDSKKRFNLVKGRWTNQG